MSFKLIEGFQSSTATKSEDMKANQAGENPNWKPAEARKVL